MLLALVPKLHSSATKAILIVQAGQISVRRERLSKWLKRKRLPSQRDVSGEWRRRSARLKASGRRRSATREDAQEPDLPRRVHRPDGTRGSGRGDVRSLQGGL